MNGFEQVVTRLTAESIQATIWVDGGFVSEKIDPSDIDVVVEIDPKSIVSRKQEDVMRQIDADKKSGVLKQDFLCDLYWLVKNFPDQAAYNHRRNYWIDQFGSDRSRVLKGIITLTI